MQRAIYPGSFDPITNGHLDIAERAARLFDEVVIAVLINAQKKSLFSIEERVAMIRSVVSDQSDRFQGRVKVDTFDGLLVEYGRQQGASAVVRGIRAISDYEYEQQLALMNRRLAPQIETVFLLSAQEFSYISSRIVKEAFSLGGNIDGLVPDYVIEQMKLKAAQGAF